MEEHGRSISAEVFAQVVEESNGYPCFVQLWGRLLWIGIPYEARPVSLVDVERVRPRFENTRNICYRDRYMELQCAELGGVAGRLAHAFAGADKLTDLDVDQTIRVALDSEGRNSGSKSVISARDQLYDLGYIRSQGVESPLYFGLAIPSLMHYVARYQGIDVSR